MQTEILVWQKLYIAPKVNRPLLLQCQTRITIGDYMNNEYYEKLDSGFIKCYNIVAWAYLPKGINNNE